MRKYSFSQRVINGWNKLPNDCVNASSVNMLKNRIDISDKGGLHIDEKIVGLSISQWLPCPLAIWNLLFGMAILLNLLPSWLLLLALPSISMLPSPSLLGLCHRPSPGPQIPLSFSHPSPTFSLPFVLMQTSYQLSLCPF